MTTEEVKQILRQARKIDARIKLLEESQKKAYAKITSATQKLSETGVHAAMGTDAMAEYVAYSEEIVAEIENLQKMQTEILHLIGKVKRIDLRNLLQLYYVDGHTWEEVAVKMMYSWRWVMKLHSKALAEVARIAEKEKRLHAGKSGHRKTY